MMIWKSLLHYWPFVRRIHWWLVDCPHQVELWCFLCCYIVKAVEITVELSVDSDTWNTCDMIITSTSFVPTSRYDSEVLFFSRSSTISLIRCPFSSSWSIALSLSFCMDENKNQGLVFQRLFKFLIKICKNNFNIPGIIHFVCFSWCFIIVR